MHAPKQAREAEQGIDIRRRQSQAHAHFLYRADDAVEFYGAAGLDILQHRTHRACA